MRRYIYVMIIVALVLMVSGCGSGGNSTVVDDTKGIELGLREFERALDLTRFGMDVTAARQAVLAQSYAHPSNPNLSINLWFQIKQYTFVSWGIAQTGNTAAVQLTYTVTDSTTNATSNNRTKTFTMQKFGDRWLVNLKEFTGLD